jgi:hypothetical protein
VKNKYERAIFNQIFFNRKKFIRFPKKLKINLATFPYWVQFFKPIETFLELDVRSLLGSILINVMLKNLNNNHDEFIFTTT